MNQDKWITEKHIKFSIASEDDITELIQFLHENFFPDEPTTRNLKTMEGNGWIDNFLRKFVDKVLITEPILNVKIAPASIVARSTVDNSIVGCRIGEIMSRENVKDMALPPILWIGSLPAFLPIPKKLIDFSNMIQLFYDLNYGKPQAFEELKYTDQIYFAANVCVSNKAYSNNILRSIDIE